MADPSLSQPFDRAAADYDAAFTGRQLGRWLRESVWHHLAQHLRPGDRVLELGCGTGEDACWLAARGSHVTATDASPAMLDQARRKAEAAGVAERVHVAPLDLNALDRQLPPPRGAPFDGAFSNFGAINCVADRRPLLAALARWLRPGGRVLLVPMGPLCPWEIGWHLAHGQAGSAFRRLRAGADAHAGGGARVRVWYPTPRRLRVEAAPHFRHLQTVGIGSLLPPSYLAHLTERWPRPFARLAALDRQLGSTFPWTWLNDHYLLILERR